MLTINFSDALELLKEGKKVARFSWPDDIWIELQRPDEHSKMTMPYIFMSKHGERFPLDLTCESILANDWQQR